MRRELVISATAIGDIEQGVEYYKSLQKGLGRRFESSVDSAFKKIQKFPHAASFAYDKVRYKIVDKFPYVALYEFDDRYIYILRVFPTRMSPEEI
jgi:hypothetical protein